MEKVKRIVIDLLVRTRCKTCVRRSRNHSSKVSSKKKKKVYIQSFNLEFWHASGVFCVLALLVKEFYQQGRNIYSQLIIKIALISRHVDLHISPESRTVILVPIPNDHQDGSPNAAACVENPKLNERFNQKCDSSFKARALFEGMK